MKNLKVSAKLLLSFGAVLAMLIISSVVSMINMSRIEAQVYQYADVTLPNTSDIWQIRRDIVSIERDILAAITEKDQSKVNDYLDAADKDSESLLSALDSFSGNTLTDSASLQELKDSLEATKSIRTEINTLIKNGDKDGAYAVYNSKYSPSFENTAKILLGIYQQENDRAAGQGDIAKATLTQSRVILGAVIFLAVLFTLFMFVLLRKAILTPVIEIKTAAKALADGDFSAQITYSSRDELGELSESMQSLMHTVVSIIKDMDRVLHELAKGNFTVSADQNNIYCGDFASLKTSLEDITQQLSFTLSQINQASEQVAVGANQVSNGAQALSQGTTEQASSIQELSATIAEVTDQITQTADHARTANQNVELTGANLSSSNEQMKSMVAAMNEISLKSTEISKIIKVIEDIAFQTNILALNAAVEAARAGDAGKGFAVVADEVRNLASKSAEAAKSTTTLIEDTLAAVKNGSSMAAATAASLEKSADAMQAVVAKIEEIAAASDQQAQSVSQINIGVEQISSVVQTNSATAEESAAASEELSGQAQMLESLVGRFRLREESAARMAENAF